MNLKSVSAYLLIVKLFEGRPHLALVCVDGLSKICPSKVIFEMDYFFVFFGPSQIYIIFGMRTPYGLWMTKKEFLGILCPKSSV